MTLDALTPIELRTALLIRDGLSAKEIGAIMNNTEQAVKNRLHKIYGKLGVQSRTQLAVYMWEKTEADHAR